MKNLFKILITLILVITSGCYSSSSLSSSSSSLFNNDPCSKITRTVDKFTDEVTIRSPLLEKISFTKVINNIEEVIYLRISVHGSTLNYGCYGVTLLLENGEKILWKDEEVDTDYDSYGNSWKYKSFTRLTNEEIEKIITNPITDVKLYIYDSSIGNSEKFSSYLNCIVGMN